MLQKIFILVAVVAIVWYGFKLVARLDQERKRKIARTDGAPREGAADMVRCPVCDAYVAEEVKKDCGKAGCPY